MNAAASVLQLDRVNKSVGEGASRMAILKDISLDVRPGEFLAVMGPSGSGKSTLLSVMGLLDAPSQGHVRVKGQDVSLLSDNALAQMRSQTLGFVFQTFHLLPYLTVRENIELPLLYRSPHAPAAASADALLQRVRLDHRRDAYPATLSGGEKQRVAIARALINRPALLLADEPTGALDSRTGMQILELLSDLNASGMALVLITHDEKIARRAQRVMVLRDGEFE